MQHVHYIVHVLFSTNLISKGCLVLSDAIRQLAIVFLSEGIQVSGSGLNVHCQLLMVSLYPTQVLHDLV